MGICGVRGHRSKDGGSIGNMPYGIRRGQPTTASNPGSTHKALCIRGSNLPGATARTPAESSMEVDDDPPTPACCGYLPEGKTWEEVVEQYLF